MYQFGGYISNKYGQAEIFKSEARLSEDQANFTSGTG